MDNYIVKSALEDLERQENELKERYNMWLYNQGNSNWDVNSTGLNDCKYMEFLRERNTK